MIYYKDVRGINQEGGRKWKNMKNMWISQGEDLQL